MAQFVSVLVLIVVLSTINAEEVQPLYVLSLLPYSDSNGKYGWDHGLELLPAARVAVKHINNRTDILPGYEIKLIERASDACGKTIITKGLLNFVGNAVKHYKDDVHPIAVVGLACSTVTATVSPIAGRNSILQMSMAGSVFFRDNVRFPHLWRFIPSSDELIGAFVKLMEVNGWNKVGLISTDTGYFFRALAESFRDFVKINNFTLLLDEVIDPNFSRINSISIIDRIQTTRSRIILSATTLPESIELICQAAKSDILWPGYLWIFLSRNYNEFMGRINSTASQVCNSIGVPLAKALENVLLIDLELSGRQSDYDVLLSSGVTYGQYRSDYDKEYVRVQKEYEGKGIKFHSSYNVYANGMYDEILGLALSLNRSIDELKYNGLDLAEYKFNMPEITKIIERSFKNLTFSGALYDVHFNEFNEVSSSVNIFQVSDQTSEKVGIFQDSEILNLNSTRQGLLPQDSFETRYNFMSTGIVAELYVNAILLFVATTILLLISVVLRKEPELLAVSSLLNSLIFTGCYLLIFASVLSATQNYIELSEHVYITICYLHYRFGQNGIYLITATLLVRLVRVYRIFTHFGKTSKVWKDQYLFFVSLVISSLPSVITMVGVIVDPLQYSNNQEYVFDENPPVDILTPTCQHHTTFNTASDIIDKVYSVALGLLLLTFAILTRKVNKKNFKDTKKVTTFVIFFTFITSVSYIVVYILHSTERENMSLIILSYSYQIIALLSTSLLIAPKTIPALYYRIQKKKRSFHTVTDDNSTFSKAVMYSFQTMYYSSSSLASHKIKTSSPESTYDPPTVSSVS